MARPAKTKTNDSTNAPALIAWNVTQKGEASYWHKIGASWAHKDRKGMTLQLDVMPIDGRIVLREPKEPAAA